MTTATIANHTAIITVPNRTIKHGEYMAAYGACETHTAIFSTYIRLSKTAVVSYVYTNGNVEINIETRSRLSKTVMDEITRFIACGFILEANIDGVELVEKPALAVETVKEQEAAHPVASPAPFNPAPFCQTLAMAVAAYIPPFEVCGSWEVDAHFQASRQLEAWQAAHPDVDVTPLIFGYFVDDGSEIEDFDLGEPGPREGEENDDDVHPTHGALPAWMYEDEQEPYALSPAPMQQQREQEKYYNPATRAFYRYDKRPEVGDVDTIMFGYYPRDGEQGNTAEMRMSWVWLDTRVTPQLRIFDDAWAALTTMQDVLTRLGTLDDAYATPEQIAHVLLECGFEDRTRE